MKKAIVIITSLLLILMISACAQETPQKQNIFLDPDNGTNTITLMGEAGTTAVLPTPSKQGFVFIGWFDTSENKYIDNATFLESSYTLKAKWTASLSIKGTIALPNDANLTYSDFWLKVSDGTVVQISDDGSFEVKGLLTNKSYDIYFSSSMPSGLVVQSRTTFAPISYGALKSGVITSYNETKDLGVIQMTPTVTINGIVTLQGSSFNENTGITVSIPGTWFTTITDNYGNFSLTDLPEGTYKLKLSKAGYSDKEITNIILANEDPNFSSNITTDDIQLAKYEGNIIGLVNLEGLSDYSGVKVSIPGTIYETTTNELGEYVLTVTPGTYSTGLLFKAEDYASKNISTPIVVQDLESTTIETIEMKATKASLVTGVVKVKGVDDFSNINVFLSSPTIEGNLQTTTDINGKWSIKHVPLGSYTVTVEDSNIPKITTNISILPGVNDIGDYILFPGGASVHGLVSLKDKAEAEGINVVLKEIETGKTRSYITKTDGYYLFTNIDPSIEYKIMYSKEGWACSEIDVKDLNQNDKIEKDKVLIDDIEPIFESLLINNGQNTTDSRKVTINIKVADYGSGISRMILSYDETFNSNMIYNDIFKETFEIELPSGNMTHAIYVRVYDEANNFSDKNVSIKVTGTKYEVKDILSGENLIWTEENSPYVVKGNIVVPSGSMLTIEPGVDVQFDGAYYIKVEGTINAIGTEGNPISFYNSSTNYNPWRGINGVKNNIVTSGTLYDPLYVSGNILKNVIMKDGAPCAYGYLWIENAIITADKYSLGQYDSLYFDNKNKPRDYNLSSDNSKSFRGYLIDGNVSGTMSLYNAHIIKANIDSTIVVGEYYYLISSVIQDSAISNEAYFINNIFKNSYVWRSEFDEGFKQLDYNTFDNCIIFNSTSRTPKKILKYNNFLNCSFYDSADWNYYLYSFQYCNFEGNTNISVPIEAKNLSVDYTYNYWGDNTFEIKTYSQDTSNLTFIYDYFNDFSRAKVNCSNWVETPWPHIGYYPDRRQVDFEATLVDTYIDVADDRSVSGYFEIEVETKESDENMFFRVTDDLNDLSSTDKDHLNWEYNTNIIKYEFKFEEMKDIVLYLQYKDGEGFISEIISIKFSKEIATSANIRVKGPAGGYICYYNPNYEKDGWKYLEISPRNMGYNMDTKELFSDRNINGSNILTTFPFGLSRNENNEHVLVGTETGIGKGKINTIKLVEAMGNAAYTQLYTTMYDTTDKYAANLVSRLTCNGYSDWFLPSLEEMKLVISSFENRSSSPLTCATYSTSSEASNEKYYYLLLSNNPREFGKNGYETVWPVRTF